MPEPAKKPAAGADNSGGSWVGTIMLLFIGGAVGAIGARMVSKMLDDPPQQQALPPAGYPPPPGYYYPPPAMPPWYPR